MGNSVCIVQEEDYDKVMKARGNRLQATDLLTDACRQLPVANKCVIKVICVINE